MTQHIQAARAVVGDDARQDPAKVVAIPAQERDAEDAPRPHTTAAQKHLLMFRFALFNLAAFALFGATYLHGWINTVVVADSTKLSIAIFVVFLCGLTICVRKIWWVSTELNCVRNFNPCHRSWAAIYLSEVRGRGSGSRAIAGSALSVSISTRITVVRHIANSLVLLGLIGTVLGFIIALSGVDPSTAGDVRAVAPMVTNLIGGMSVALYTTLVGAVLNLWLLVNYHILMGGAAKLLTALVSLGEANARPQPD